MDENDAPDDPNGTTMASTTRRRFAKSAAITVGALCFSGLAAAHHDGRSEQGEQNGNDDGAHENGRGRGHDDDDGPGNSGEHRRDDGRDEEDDDDGDRDDGENGGDDGENNDVQVTARRDDDGSVFFLPAGPGADLNQVDLIVEASQPVLVRDQFPSDWMVVKGDPYTTYTEGDTRFVEFTNPVEDDTRTYFAEIPDNTGADEFGPIEYSLDGETWTEIPGTTETNLVAAAGTSI